LPSIPGIHAPSLIAALICIPLGLGAKGVDSGTLGWISRHGAGAVFVAFWTFAVLSRFPRKPWRAAGLVLLATSLGECLQLWQPDWLQSLRGHLVGDLLLGSTFSAADFLPYSVGAALAAVIGGRLIPVTEADRLSGAASRETPG
jgi:hypothetical protein